MEGAGTAKSELTKNSIGGFTPMKENREQHFDQ